MASSKVPKDSRVGGVVIISDTHCGSSVGLWPENHMTRTGNIVSLGENLHQQWLWSCWTEAVSRAIKHFAGRPFYVVCNGDLIEGVHHGTKEIVAIMLEDHANAAIECLKPLIDAAAKSFFIAGTECHVGDWERYICNQLEGTWGGDKLLLEVNGTLCDFAHHMPTTSRAYLEAGAMSIVMGNARVNYARCGHRVPKVFARGHRHVGGYFHDGRGLFLVTPAWQLLTRYGHKVVGDSICSPGITILDWAGVSDGETPSCLPIVFNPDETRPIEH